MKKQKKYDNISYTILSTFLTLGHGFTSEQDDTSSSQENRFNHIPVLVEYKSEIPVEVTSSSQSVRTERTVAAGQTGNNNHDRSEREKTPPPISQSIQEKEKKPQDYYREGIDYFHQHEYDLAAVNLIRALGEEEKYTKVNGYIYLAECQYQSNHFSEAIQAYHRALELEPSDKAYKGLMRIRYKLGRASKLEEKQRRYFSQALEYYKQMNVTTDSDDEIYTVLSTHLKEVPTPPLNAAPLSALSVPAFAKGYEAIYNRFVNGELVFDNGQGQRKEFPFSQFKDTLEGEFDLSGLTVVKRDHPFGVGYPFEGDYVYYVSKDLSINLGFRRERNPAHADKVEIWILPKFLMGMHIDGAAKDYKTTIWNDWTSEVGILWNLGDLPSRDGDHLGFMNLDFDEIPNQILHDLLFFPKPRVNNVPRMNSYYFLINF